MIAWRVVAGAILIVIAVVRVFQSLPFLGGAAQHEWMPVFYLVMALFLVVGLWLIVTGARGKAKP